MTKREIAEKIAKSLEQKSVNALGSINHSYMLGALEVIFGNVFEKLSDEDVEFFKERHSIG